MTLKRHHKGNQEFAGRRRVQADALTPPDPLSLRFDSHFAFRHAAIRRDQVDDAHSVYQQSFAPDFKPSGSPRLGWYEIPTEAAS